MTQVRKGQFPGLLCRAQFHEQFRQSYAEPYATSHDTLDADTAAQEEVRNVARALVEAVRELRAGTQSTPDANLPSPRPK